MGWLPAKSKITTHLVMFYSRVPEGFARVHDFRLENGQIIVADDTAKKAGAAGSIVETLKHSSQWDGRSPSNQEFDQDVIASAIIGINHR